MKKALSDEEWGDRALIAERLGYAHVHDGNDTVELDGCFSGDERHAVAALCLNGKAFGFTWDDVEFLKDVEEQLSGTSHRDLFDQLHGLQERIEALLPPRVP